MTFAGDEASSISTEAVSNALASDSTLEDDATFEEDTCLLDKETSPVLVLTAMDLWSQGEASSGSFPRSKDRCDAASTTNVEWNACASESANLRAVVGDLDAELDALQSELDEELAAMDDGESESADSHVRGFGGAESPRPLLADPSLREWYTEETQRVDQRGVQTRGVETRSKSNDALGVRKYNDVACDAAGFLSSCPADISALPIASLAWLTALLAGSAALANTRDAIMGLLVQSWRSDTSVSDFAAEALKEVFRDSLDDELTPEVVLPALQYLYSNSPAWGANGRPPKWISDDVNEDDVIPHIVQMKEDHVELLQGADDESSDTAEDSWDDVAMPIESSLCLLEMD